MRSSHLLALGLAVLVGGITFLSLAVLFGSAHVAVVLIVPVLYGSSPYLALGVLLLVLGFFLTFLGWASMAGDEVALGPATPIVSPTGGSADRSEGTRRSYGGFLLIGPIPVVFGNRPAWMPYLVAMGIILMLALILFFVFV
jgi:uncharacterized protein (TIGR00304 family)